MSVARVVGAVVLLLKTNALEAWQGGAPVRQVDHFIIATSERPRLEALLTDTLQLPMVWGRPGTAFTATAGLALGDVNLELAPREDAREARLTAVALQPVALREVCRQLGERGLELREPAICESDPGARRWTVVGFRHGFEGPNFFVIQYHAIDMDERRTRFGRALDERHGGPLGLVRVRELRLRYAPDMLAAAREAWRRLLGPGPGDHFILASGPSIRLQEGAGASLLVEVRELAAAERAARSLGLLDAVHRDSLTLNRARLGGLAVTLVNR